MPWHIEMMDGKHCVVKDDTGETVACHPTPEEARAHMAALYANEPSAKAGAAISRANMARLQSMHDMAVQMGAQCDTGGHDYTPIGKAIMKTEPDGQHPASHYLVVEDPEAPSTWHLRVKDASGEIDPRLLGASWAALHEGYRGNKYEGPNKQTAIAKLRKLYQQAGMQAPDDRSAKAADIEIEEAPEYVTSIKALGDRTIELRVAYGMDAHGEYFSPRTDFDLDHFPTPPVLYYHGYDENGKPMGRPIAIGKTTQRENRDDGHYLTAKLYRNKYADRTWDAALKGQAAASPGTAGHLRRKSRDGHLDYWPIVEISAWDWADNRKQAHARSIARPVLKAAYLEAGIDVPEAIDGDTPEAPLQGSGDGSTAGAVQSLDTLSPQEAGRLIAKIIADQLLIFHKETTDHDP